MGESGAINNKEDSSQKTVARWASEAVVVELAERSQKKWIPHKLRTEEVMISSWSGRTSDLPRFPAPKTRRWSSAM